MGDGGTLLRVASRMRYRCEACNGTGRDLLDTVKPCYVTECREGWVYPLQEACKDHNPEYGEGTRGNIRCPDCDGRRWVPVALGPYTLEASAARCGYAVEIQSRRRQAVAVWNPPLPGGIRRNGRSKWYDYTPTDAESIKRAVLEALDEVVPQVDDSE